MTRRKKPSETYSGALAEPLKPRILRKRKLNLFRRRRRLLGVTASPTPSPPAAVASKPSRIPEWRWDRDQKFPLLMDHFGINKEDPYCWKILAQCLAVAHVPGFQEKPRRKAGRKRTVSWEEEAKLYARFCELTKKENSARSVAAIMAKELQKAGHAKVSSGAILRRMQRYAERLKKLWRSSPA